MDSHREAARDTHLVAGRPTPPGMKCRDTRMKLLQQLTRALDTETHTPCLVDSLSRGPPAQTPEQGSAQQVLAARGPRAPQEPLSCKSRHGLRAREGNRPQRKLVLLALFHPDPSSPRDRRQHWSWSWECPGQSGVRGQCGADVSCRPLLAPVAAVSGPAATG